MFRRTARAVRRRFAPRSRLSGAPGRSSARSTDRALRREARAILRSPLFDAAWYFAQSGGTGTPLDAATDYLRRGYRRGLSPHPLFDPQFVARKLPTRDDGEPRTDLEPLTYFLRTPRVRRRSTHPLFNARRYAETYPEAREHPLGPTGHYLEIGAAAGAQPNDWYRPDPVRDPQGLADWIRRATEKWITLHRTLSLGRPTAPDTNLVDAAKARYGTDLPPRADADDVLVSVVLAVRDGSDLVATAVESVLKQSVGDLEVVVVDDGSDDGDALAAALAPYLDDGRVRVVRQDRIGLARARNHGLEQARGTYVAFIDADVVWVGRHLQLCLGAICVEGAQAAFDVLATRNAQGKRRFSATDVTSERLRVAPLIDQSSLVVERRVASAIGFDETLPRAVNHDFALRLFDVATVHSVPVVGARTDPRRSGRRRLAAALPATWNDVVLNRHLVDWEQLERRGPGTPGTVSVIIPTPGDWSLTTAAVASVAAAAETSAIDVEIIVVDNGSGPAVAATLASLVERFPAVTIVDSPVNRGFALGNNIALEHVSGEIVVFLNNDTEVSTGWLEPLVDALADDDVLGAQSLLVYPSGSIQSAGVAFPSCGGIPHVLLQGFPVEDAAGMQTLKLSALTGAALAMRFSDVVAARGFDPIFLNGMEDVDLGLRMARLRPGHFVVRPDSVVLHRESRSPGRFLRSVANRRTLLERWGERMPGDDAVLWADRGFDVVGHEVRNIVEGQRRLSVPEPILVRSPRVSVDEPFPSLRWALKNPAPAGPEAEHWGDTHFARALAGALRAQGQEVVIDHRPEFERRSGRLDDVVLHLRGLAGYSPVYGQVSLTWLISHPEMFTAREAASFDRVFAASVPWADRMSRLWGVRIDPLLQATDPQRFNPDLAAPDSGDAVLFVGSSRNVVRPVIRDAIAAGLDVSIYGSGWQGFVPEEHVKARYLPNEQVGAAYRSAGVVLNDHWEDMRTEGFLSNRLFDAAAAGARVISDDIEGLAPIFGRSVQVARTPADLARLARPANFDANFGDDAERRAVAATIHRDHSFAARATELVKVALELRRD